MGSGRSASSLIAKRTHYRRSFSRVVSAQPGIYTAVGATVGAQNNTDSIHISKEVSEYLNSFLAMPNSETSSLESSGVRTKKLRHKRDQASITEQNREKHRSLRQREEGAYRRTMSILRVNNILNSFTTSPLVYVFGSRVTMLSLKLAQLQAVQGAANGLVVSVLTNAFAVQPHLELLELQSVVNNLVCQSEMSLLQIAALLGAPERASHALIQSDVITRLISIAFSTEGFSATAPLFSALSKEDVTDAEIGKPLELERNDNKITELSATCRADLLEELLAAVLQLAGVSVVEMPSSARLRTLLSKLVSARLFSASTSTQFFSSVDCLDYLLERYAEPGALLGLSLQKVTVHGVNPRGDISSPGKIFVSVSELEGNSDEFSEVQIFSVHIRVVEGDIDVSSESTTSGIGSEAGAETGSISLYTALHFGMTSESKRKTLKLILDFPFWRLSSTAIPSAASTVVEPKNKGDTGDKGYNNKRRGAAFSEESVAHTTRTEDPADLLRPWNLYLSIRRSARSPSFPGSDLSTPYTSLSSMALTYFPHTSALVSHGAAAISAMGSASGLGSIDSDRRRSRYIWRSLQSEMAPNRADMANGKFSLVEHNSGMGHLSALIARHYPNATVLSLERAEAAVKHHVALIAAMDIQNNAVCVKPAAVDDTTIYRNIYETPEFFRYQGIA